MATPGCSGWKCTGVWGTQMAGHTGGGGGQVKCAAARITQENRQEMLSGDKQRVEEGSLREEQDCHEATLRGETDPGSER